MKLINYILLVCILMTLIVNGEENVKKDDEDYNEEHTLTTGPFEESDIDITFDDENLDMKSTVEPEKLITQAVTENIDNGTPDEYENIPSGEALQSDDLPPDDELTGEPNNENGDVEEIDLPVSEIPQEQSTDTPKPDKSLEEIDASEDNLPNPESTDSLEVVTTVAIERESTENLNVDVEKMDEVTPAPESEQTNEIETELSEEPIKVTTTEPEISEGNEDELTNQNVIETTAAPENEQTNEIETELSKEPIKVTTTEPEISEGNEDEFSNQNVIETTAAPENEQTNEIETELSKEPIKVTTNEPEISDSSDENEIQQTESPDIQITDSQVSITEIPQIEDTNAPEIDQTQEPETVVTEPPEQEIIENESSVTPVVQPNQVSTEDAEADVKEHESTNKPEDEIEIDLTTVPIIGSTNAPLPLPVPGPTFEPDVIGESEKETEKVNETTDFVENVITEETTTYSSTTNILTQPPTTTTIVSTTTIPPSTTTTPISTVTTSSTTTTTTRPFTRTYEWFSTSFVIPYSPIYSSLCNNIECPFGFKTDLYGKVICSCFNPCENMNCERGYCKITVSNNSNNIGAVCVKSEIKEERPLKCMLPPESGNCPGHYESRYYWNPLKNRCSHFIYTGCNGNENNFESLERCNAECNICALPIYRGPCKGQRIRYSYDAKTKSCITFSYGGCQGNQNNFATKEICENTCIRFPKYIPKNPRQYKRNIFKRR